MLPPYDAEICKLFDLIAALSCKELGRRGPGHRGARLVSGDHAVPIQYCGSVAPAPPPRSPPSWATSCRPVEIVIAASLHRARPGRGRRPCLPRAASTTTSAAAAAFSDPPTALAGPRSPASPVATTATASTAPRAPRSRNAGELSLARCSRRLQLLDHGAILTTGRELVQLLRRPYSARRPRALRPRGPRDAPPTGYLPGGAAGELLASSATSTRSTSATEPSPRPAAPS